MMGSPQNKCLFLRPAKDYQLASCEVRTHASFDSRVENELKSTALDHSAKLAIRFHLLICVLIPIFKNRINLTIPSTPIGDLPSTRKWKYGSRGADRGT